MTSRPVPQRRAGDQGRWAYALEWWRRNGGIVVGPWLMVVSAVVVVIALEMRADDVATEKAARVSCERARQFAPRLIDDYEARRVFTRAELEQYRASIPKTCPK